MPGAGVQGVCRRGPGGPAMFVRYGSLEFVKEPYSAGAGPQGSAALEQLNRWGVLRAVMHAVL